MKKENELKVKITADTADYIDSVNQCIEKTRELIKLTEQLNKLPRIKD